jgi:hypothetical protein
LTAQRRYVDEMLRIFAEMAVEAAIAENAPGNSESSRKPELI